MDYYQVLGVSRNATSIEIKKAYREEALRWHPDRAGGNKQRFQLVGEAYTTLMNEERRSQYDGTLPSEAKRGGGVEGGPPLKKQRRESLLESLGAGDEVLWRVYETTPPFNEINDFKTLMESLNDFEKAVRSYRTSRERYSSNNLNLNVDLNYIKALGEAFQRDVEVCNREAQVKEVAIRLLSTIR